MLTVKTDGLCEKQTMRDAETERYIEWIRSELKRTGKTQSALAKHLNIAHPQITQLLKGNRRLKVDEVPAIADFLGVPPPELARVPEGAEFPPDPDFDDTLHDHTSTAERELSDVIPEVDAKAGAGQGQMADDRTVTVGAGGIVTSHRVVAEWSIPDSFIRHGLGAQPRKTWILEVIGDSMQPTLNPGDRVIYDIGDQVVNPDGIFVIDEGYGPMVKRLHRVRGANPLTFDILSDNPSQPSYQLKATEFRVIGRVCGRVSRM